MCHELFSLNNVLNYMVLLSVGDITLFNYFL